MNPFSEIELDLLNGFALFIAGIIAFGGVIVLACITYLETRDWWQAAHAPEPAPPVTVTQPEAVPTRVTLYVVPDPPHQPWVDDAQGHRVVRGKGVGK